MNILGTSFTIAIMIALMLTLTIGNMVYRVRLAHNPTFQFHDVWRNTIIGWEIFGLLISLYLSDIHDNILISITYTCMLLAANNCTSKLAVHDSKKDALWYSIAFFGYCMIMFITLK